MESLIHPGILYTCLALGAVGVLLALPRKGGGPQALGGLIAAAFFGLLILVLAIKAGPDRPNVFFYIFGLLALAGALRVITHPRPVYAALYFIMTVLSSAGLYLLLASEFMTFALVIIYAGAILITYLFVIMLATEAPSREAVDALQEYDASSNEPIGATAMGFALLGVLTGMFAFGVPQLMGPEPANPDQILVSLPRKVQGAFERAGLVDGSVLPLMPGPAGAAPASDVTHSLYWVKPRSTDGRWPGTSGHAMLRTTAPREFQARLDATRAVARGEDPPAHVRPFPPEALALFNPDIPGVLAAAVPDPEDPTRTIQHGIVHVRFPEDLQAANIELVGFALLREHPLAIELAGVVLLLAMVGAVILARKQIEAPGPAPIGTIADSGAKVTA